MDFSLLSKESNGPTPQKNDAPKGFVLTEDIGYKGTEIAAHMAWGAATEPPKDHAAHPRKQSKWTPEEDQLVTELREGGMKWEDISKRVAGRSAISCRLRYQKNKRPVWDEEKKNRLARLYNRFKQPMWEMIAKEMNMHWRAVEATYWQIGPERMMQRADDTFFQTAPSPSQRPEAGLLTPIERKGSSHAITPIESLKSKGRRRLPIEAHNVLQNWLQDHLTDPYPTNSEKQQLAGKTGLTTKQVSTWFTNNRKRQLDPLDQWLSGSSEDEAASSKAIARALHIITPNYTPPNLNRNSSYATSDHGSVGSANSAFSQCNDAVWSGPHRQGKRKHGSYYGNGAVSPIALPTLVSPRAESPYVVSPYLSSPPVSNEPPKPALPIPHRYQCTFCHIQLTPKAWKRHEETRHLPRAQWTCLANGPFFAHSSDSADTLHAHCVFCGMSRLQPDHAERCHRTSECMSKPEAERTFIRKDGLVQHLRGFHGAFLLDEVIDSWKKEPNYSHHKWNCGFCSKELESWDTRAAHISEHFRQGLTMAAWDSTRINVEQLSSINADQLPKNTTTDLERSPMFQVPNFLHLDDPNFWNNTASGWKDTYPISGPLLATQDTDFSYVGSAKDPDISMYNDSLFWSADQGFGQEYMDSAIPGMVQQAGFL